MYLLGMKQNTIHINTKDGYTLTGIIREPEDQPKGTVIINTGIGLPQSIYSNFANFLAKKGYVSLTYDYRGIGLSAPESLKNFSATCLQWGQLDMPAAYNWLLHHFPHLPTSVIGHSMGGQLLGLMDNYAQLKHLIFLSVSTGYWKHLSGSYKWFKTPLGLFCLVPIMCHVFGYAKMKWVAFGEDLPKGAALQWGRWCKHPTYFLPEFKAKGIPTYYNQISARILSVQFSDDPIANETTIENMLTNYSNAEIRRKTYSPEGLNDKKIGHVGMFSRRFASTFWQDMVEELDNYTQRKSIHH